ncbi:MAG: hypothetical protein ACFB21_05805 [Opitutales bacterium]
MNPALAAFSALLLSALLTAVDAHGQSEPPFVYEPVLPSAETTVFGVASTEIADVVLLEAGLDQGFRSGALCQVFNGPDAIAEIILVEVRTDRAAGLITALTANQTIESGDTVRLKATSLAR